MPNNVFTKQSDSVPLHSVPVNSVEHSSLNSGMPKFHQNATNSRPSCQISFHWIPPDSAKMTGFQQELGGHCKDLDQADKKGFRRKLHNKRA